MEIVRYQQFFEFHFAAGLKPERLAQFLNMLPMGFRFRAGPGEIFFDPERGPGVYSLHLKQYPPEEKVISRNQANYYIRWAVPASAGNSLHLVVRLARQLKAELETQVWVLDGYGRPLKISDSSEELSA